MTKVTVRGESARKTSIRLVSITSRFNNLHRTHAENNPKDLLFWCPLGD
jgi:hypothetical protein